MTHADQTHGRGLTLGVTAYLLWGAFPLYFPLLEPATPWEVLAQRIVWSVVTMALIVVLTRRTASLRAVVGTRRVLTLLAIAGGVISINWATYIWAINNDHVVEASLGYFINPLVTVLLAVFVLGERLRPLQWTALAIGAVSVGVLTWDYGRLPWVALILAFSFGSYGLLKKRANVGAIESLTVETACVAPVALSYVVWLSIQHEQTFVGHGTGHTALFLTTGIVTAVPLMLFGAAATRVPLVTLGLLQYLAPILQFLIGILIVGEAMPTARWVGFGLVWLALVMFTSDALRARKRVPITSG